jgi:hypothetical protein
MDDFPGKSKSLLTDHHLRAIGAVIVNWNAIEMAMELAILGLYEVTADRGMVLTANISFQNKLTILRILATRGAIKDQTEAKSFVSLLERIEKAHIKRNEIAHGLWAKGKADGLATRMAIRVRGRRLSTISEQIPLADIEAIASDFADAWGELIDASNRLGIRPELKVAPAQQTE